jgi:hypothetical protein
MNTATIKAIRSILELDETVSQHQKKAIIRFLSEVDPETFAPIGENPNRKDRILLRAKEVASILSIDVRTVHLLSQTGVLRKVRLPGRERGIGFRADDVHQLVEDSTVKEVPTQEPK